MNYSSQFYMQILKHIKKTIAFTDTSSVDAKAIKGIAKVLTTDGAIPIPDATFGLVSQYFQYVEDRQALLAYDPSNNIWRFHGDTTMLENFISDFFTCVLEVAKDCNDSIYKEYATHFFSGNILKTITSRIAKSSPLRISHNYELVEKNANLRYFTLSGPASEGGRVRGLLDMSKDSFNLEAVTWKDTLQQHLTNILPQPIATDSDDEPKLFLSLIEDYMLHDPERIEYFHKVLAYLMHPYNHNQCLIYFYGEKGKNGKSTILKVLSDILGPHAAAVDVDLLNANPRMSFKRDDTLAGLDGKSLFMFNEIEERVQLSTKNLKDITEGGRDSMGNKIRTSVRPAYEKQHDVCIQGIPLLSANSLFNISEWASLDSIFRRLVLVSFDYHIDVEDPSVLDRLAKEYPQIQLWLYRNYFKYKGIDIKDVKRPKDFEKLLIEYRQESDLTNMFLTDCIERTNAQSDRIKRSDLYRMYCKYCKVNGRNPIRNKGTNGFSTLISKYMPKNALLKTNGDFVYTGFKPSQFYEEDINNAPTTY